MIQQPKAELLTVATRDGTCRLAALRRDGGPPGFLWLGGYRSTMRGAKAEAVDVLAAATGRATYRFDYSGHGESEGRIEEGTIGRWLDEARSALAETAGPQIVIGSSMGGWLALLLAESLHGPDSRIAGLVLIAPAIDMTETLLWDIMPAAAKAAVMAGATVRLPSPSGGADIPVTRALIEDGRRYHLGDRLVALGCPIHILHGMLDREVPYRSSTALIERLASDDATLTLVPDGDHRLSRPEDLDRLRAAIVGMMALIDP